MNSEKPKKTSLTKLLSDVAFDKNTKTPDVLDPKSSHPLDANDHITGLQPVGKVPGKANKFGRRQGDQPGGIRTCNAFLSPLAEVANLGDAKHGMPIAISEPTVDIVNQLIEDGLYVARDMMADVKMRLETDSTDPKEREFFLKLMELLLKFRRTELAALQIEKEREARMAPAEALRYISARLESAGIDEASFREVRAKFKEQKDESKLLKGGDDDER
jgi:hypothetical protein